MNIVEIHRRQSTFPHKGKLQSKIEGLVLVPIPPGKLSVGGLSWQTCEEKLREYFQQFRQVEDVLIMEDPGKYYSFSFEKSS